MISKSITRQIPNIITSFRIVGAIVLLFLKALSLPFYIVYAICGATDALDGFVARKFHLQSKLGSILDSVSDWVFYIVLAIKIFPKMMECLSIGNWLMIIIPFVFHMSAYIICFIKFRKFSSVHTYANKIMSFELFLFPFTFIGDIPLLYNLYIYIGGVVAIYSSIEMNLIHIISKRYDERNKTIFLVKKNEKDLQTVIE